MKISTKLAVMFGVLGLAAGTAGTIALQSHAQTTSAATGQSQTANFGWRKNFTPPAAVGSVTAVNGNILTVTDQKNNTSYTVDVSNATIKKMGTATSGTSVGQRPQPITISASDIKVGDNVSVQGAVNGQTIIATQVLDGKFMGHGMRGGPGAMGKVTAINGNTITITGKNGSTVTVDAGSSSVEKMVSSSVPNIQVGDSLMVKGSKNGNSITASSIVDGQFPTSNSQNPQANQ